MNATTRKETSQIIPFSSFPSIAELMDKFKMSKKKNSTNEIEKEKEAIVRNYISPLTFLQKALNEKKYKIKPNIQLKYSAKTSRNTRKINLITKQVKAKSFIIQETNAKDIKHHTLIKTRNPSKKDNIVLWPSIGKYTINSPNSNTVAQSCLYIKNLHLDSVKETLAIHFKIAQCNREINYIIQKIIETPNDINEIYKPINAYFVNIDRLFDISNKFKCTENKESKKICAVIVNDKFNAIYINLIKYQIIIYTIIHLAIVHLPTEDVKELLMNNIRSIMKTINYPLNLIYGNYMIVGKVIKAYNGTIYLKKLFIDQLLSYYKKYKIKLSKDNCLLLTISKSSDACFRELKEYVNHTMKYSKLKQFYNSMNSIIEMLHDKTEEFISRLSIACVIYFEYQKSEKSKYHTNSIISTQDSKSKNECMASMTSEDSLMINYLPPINFTYTYSLVVDLDETLVHYIQINSEGTYFIRPFCFDFLEELYNKYELIVFTAGTKEVSVFNIII